MVWSTGRPTKSVSATAVLQFRPVSNQIVVVDGKPVVARQISRKDAMARAEMFVAKNLTKYLKKLHELAFGVTAIKETKDGPLIYTVPPDRAALTYLIDRGLGKIPERHEITGPDGGAIEVLPWAPAGMIINGEYQEVTDGPKTIADVPSTQEQGIHSGANGTLGSDEEGTEEEATEAKVPSEG